MAVSWFCFFHHSDPKRSLSQPDHQALVATLRGCPDLVAGYLYTASSASHPYSAAGVGPMLALELEFATVTACENNLRDNAYLQRLADPNFLPSLNGAEASQQGMLGRHIPVADPGRGDRDGTTCTYLVDYPGPAEDEQAWHYNYLESHTWIMRKFPGIRAAAVYTRAVVVSRLPFRIATAMQRNKVVFDSAEALSEALASPVREEMRADMARFPPYAGGSGHLPMDTVVVSGPGGRPTGP